MTAIKRGERRILPRRSPVIIALTIVTTLLLAWGLIIVISNRRFEWGLVYSYLFKSQILTGVFVTLQLTIIAMLIGVSLGTILAVMRLSEHAVFRFTSAGFIWFFRGTPLLVQLIFWFNFASLFPTIDFGLPFSTPFLSLDANEVITRTTAAILGLGLNEGAYMAEIIRGGIQSIGRGQSEAAGALGMSRSLVFRRVVLPQAMSVIIPPTGNQLIGMLKATSLVSVLAISDLLYSAQTIYSQNFQTIPLLITASVWYLAITTVLSWGQGRIERYYGRGKGSLPTRARRVPVSSPKVGVSA
jgi:polar amino acid transport system permease protein